MMGRGVLGARCSVLGARCSVLGPRLRWRGSPSVHRSLARVWRQALAKVEDPCHDPEEEAKRRRAQGTGLRALKIQDRRHKIQGNE